MTSTRLRRGLFGVAALSSSPARSAWSHRRQPPTASSPGSPGLGDPFFPLAGNGGYDVDALLADAGLRPGHEPARRAPRRSPRPRRRTSPASTSTCAASRSRACSSTAAPRRSRASGEQELVITPRAGLAVGLGVHRGDRLRGHAGGRHRPRRVDRGLGPDRRRRVRRRRAAGLAGLVPGQRQPARQGDVRLRGHRARRASP